MGDLNWRAGISRGASSLAQSMRENAAYNRAMQQKEADRQYAEERYIMQANERERYRQDTEADRQAWRDEVDPLVEMPQGYTPEQWSAIADPVVQGPEGFQSASPTMQTEMARSSVAARMKPDQQKAQAESKYGPEAWDFYERQQRLLASLKEESAISKDERSGGGQKPMTESQYLTAHNKRVDSIIKSNLGEYKMGVSDINVSGTDFLSSEVASLSGTQELGAVYDKELMMASRPFVSELVGMRNDDGSMVFPDTAEGQDNITELAFQMMYDANPGMFPSANFDQEGLGGYDEYDSDSKTFYDVDDQKWPKWGKGEKYTQEEVVTALTKLWKKSKNKPFTYASFVNGLTDIGMTGAEATEMLSSLDGVDVNEKIKEYRKAVAVPENLAAKVEDELGYMPESKYDNGVWKFQLEDGSWNEWRD